MATNGVTRAQVEALAAAGAAARSTLFGTSGTYNGTTITAVFAGASAARDVVDGGLELAYDGILRVGTAVVANPALGDVWVNTGGDGRTYRVAEIRPHGINPEWVLGLKRT